MRRLLAILLGSLCAALLVVWFYPSGADFRPDNPRWNGLSQLVAEARITPLIEATVPPESPKTTALIVIPYHPVDGTGLAALKRYVDGGGMLAVFDKFGSGNTILQALGVRARFAGAPLLDYGFHYVNRRLPKIIDVGLVPPGSRIILNHPAALRETQDMAVVAQSSRYSFLDAARTGAFAPGDPFGSFVVAAWMHTAGGGALFLASDPSLLVNGMLDLRANRQFALGVLRLAGNRKVFLDEVHLPAGRLDRVKRFLREVDAALSAPAVVLLAACASVAGPLVLKWGRL